MSEFQKRAKKLWKDKPYELIPDDFIKIVEEAKKEIPWSLNPNNTWYTQLPEDIIQEREEMKAWIKRWFFNEE